MISIQRNALKLRRCAHNIDFYIKFKVNFEYRLPHKSFTFLKQCFNCLLIENQITEIEKEYLQFTKKKQSKK